MILSQEILEHVLQFADGETLLMCRDVSPEFAAAVKYLSKRKNIWEECYLKEKGETYPFGVISKFHPHNEGLNHRKDWGVIYETCTSNCYIASKEPSYLGELKIGTENSDIQDVEIHGDLLLVLVKYNQDFSIYYKFIIVNLKNDVIDKSCRFNANMLYITPIEDSSSLRRDAIMLPCKLCKLAAVPVFADETIVGYPKFKRKDDFLTIEHSNGEVLWMNDFRKLLTKGKCFHTGTAKHEEVKLKSLKTIKVFLGFTSLFISCGQTRREFNTFKDFRASATASLCYSNLLFLGTDTGMLYVYKLSGESDLKLLNLGCYIQQFDICSNSILVINVMELKHHFVIICCSEKTLYQLHINRKLKNFC